MGLRQKETEVKNHILKRKIEGQIRFKNWLNNGGQVSLSPCPQAQAGTIKSVGEPEEIGWSTVAIGIHKFREPIKLWATKPTKVCQNYHSSVAPIMLTEKKWTKDTCNN